MASSQTSSIYPPESDASAAAPPPSDTKTIRINPSAANNGSSGKQRKSRSKPRAVIADTGDIEKPQQLQEPHAEQTAQQERQQLPQESLDVTKKTENNEQHQTETDGYDSPPLASDDDDDVVDGRGDKMIDVVEKHEPTTETGTNRGGAPTNSQPEKEEEDVNAVIGNAIDRDVNSFGGPADTDDVKRVDDDLEEGYIEGGDDTPPTKDEEQDEDFDDADVLEDDEEYDDNNYTQVDAQHAQLLDVLNHVFTDSDGNSLVDSLNTVGAGLIEGLTGMTDVLRSIDSKLNCIRLQKLYPKNKQKT